jgi:pyruvate dehydrogenase E2 component (dihydrolipoamide acetyltransferase)
MRARLSGSGPVVVLLHGQPGGARDWDLVLPLLDGLSTLTPDRPGYDGTPAQGFLGNARAVIDLLDQHGIDRAVLCGYSWGGGAALATALVAPGRVAGLTLVGSVGVRSSYTLGDQLLANPLVHWVFEALMRLGGRRLAGLSSLTTGSVLGAEEERVREDLQVARRGPAWRSFHREQQALVRETSQIERRLGRIAVPAVLLGGTRDTAVPLRAVRSLAAALPDAVVREVEAGHLMTLEAPQAIADAIRETVARSGLHAPGDAT